ncbi:CAP domain-containing protein [Streptomyces sp. NBC_01275]|uniref:CAP domain-containing protein n=1 Tax=Streptomyces sp. NBC_01275 TaxID=2903807 RepID=UPI002250A362|nr:CAP domain-containing protein [Streptomyces sp. NBC_01275]MCX4767544.1 CAP domain-containing protein [Streptomyces sp. NBC_01275]
MSELVPGGNVPLPAGALTVRVPGPFDVSALVTDDGGRVGGDGDFVFYNHPTAPGARLRGDTLALEPAGLRAGATRVTVVVSAADPDTALARLPAPTLHVADRQGRPLARFTPPPVRQERVLLLAEVYRRGGVWKLRAVGQGYADGLAGLARDFGVDVVEDEPAPAHPSASPTPPTRVPVRPSARLPGGPSAPPAHGPARTSPPPTRVPARRPTPPASPTPPAERPAPDPDGFLTLVNPARATAGSPPVSIDARLARAAREHAAAMAAAGRLGTEGGDGVSVHQRLTAAGYRCLAVGEQLVSGPRTPAEFVAYCLRTDRTRRTLHDPAFVHTAVAQVTDGRTGDTYWTALWASPLTPDGLARTAAEVVDLTNRERTRAGLRPLAVDRSLTAAAQAYSTDMAARAFYSHTSPEGAQPWDRAAAAGSSLRTIGENIACGQRSAAEVVEGWMNSPGHRANILKPAFTHIGVGFESGGPSGTYWTQLFGG